MCCEPGVRCYNVVVRDVPAGDVPAVRRVAAVRGAALPAERRGALLRRLRVHLPQVLRPRDTWTQAF